MMDINSTMVVDDTIDSEEQFALLSPPCVKINSPFVLYLMIFLHWLGGLATLCIGVYAIFRYYWKSQIDMLLKLRVSCIICTLLFIISDIDSAIDFTFAVQCNKHSYTWFAKYDAWGLIFLLLGYYMLSCIFIYKLYVSFKDSILALSRSTVIFLVSLCVSVIGLVFVDNCLKYAGIVTSGYIMQVVALIIYILGNAFLIKILISKLLSYARLQKEFETTQIGQNATVNVSVNLYQTIIKLFIVYSTAILSTVIGTAFVFLWMVILNGSDNMIYLQMTFRLSTNIDHIVNVICLLYQHDIADGLYKKTCCVCHRCITKLCQNNMMHVHPAISNMQSDAELTQSA